MRLLLIRHGDPDYERDSLTEKGRVEAELLSQRLCKMDIKAFYVSSMGRARDTISPTLEKMGREAVVCDWLREVDLSPFSLWRLLPSDWQYDEIQYDYNNWKSAELFRNTRIQRVSDYATENLDRMLGNYGYVREGKNYRVTKPNKDTLVLVTHFGLESILLSHLMNLPLLPIVKSMAAAPASVITLITEEREQGTALFRMTIGETAHLYVSGQDPALAGRYREVYSETDH